MWKLEVIEVRKRGEAKGPRVLHLSDGIWRFNPNIEDITLHKGSLSSPFTQTEVPFDIQLQEAVKKPDLYIASKIAGLLPS